MDGLTVIQAIEQAGKVGIPILFSAAAIALGTRWAWIWIGNQKAEKNEKLCLGEACQFRKEDTPYIPEDLLQHRFFSFVQHSVTNRIPYLRIKDAGRREMAKDFLTSKFNSLATTLKDIINDQDIEDMSKSELESMMQKAIESSATRGDAETMRTAFIRGGQDAMRIYVEAFREIHAPTMDQLADYTTAACNSAWMGDNNVARIATIMDFLVSVYRRLLCDAEVTMGRLNGSLTGLPYGGKVLGEPGEYHTES